MTGSRRKNKLNTPSRMLRGRKRASRAQHNVDEARRIRKDTIELINGLEAGEAQLQSLEGLLCRPCSQGPVRRCVCPVSRFWDTSSEDDSASPEKISRSLGEGSPMQKHTETLSQRDSDLGELLCNTPSSHEAQYEKPENLSAEHMFISTDLMKADEVMKVLEMIEHLASSKELGCIDFQSLRQIVERVFTSKGNDTAGGDSDDDDADVRSVNSGFQ